MNIQQSTPMTPLRARMIADMSGRNLGPASQTSHLRACKRFAAWLGRSPETATPDDVKYFQHHLVESGTSICTRNQTMTGVKFLFRVTLRRHDLVPMLRRTVDHRRDNSTNTALQSTAKTTKSRSMTRAPHITNNTLSRRRRHLRTHHHARIQLSTRQALMTLTKFRANRANADKPNPAISPTGIAQRVSQIRVKAPAQRQSP